MAQTDKKAKIRKKSWYKIFAPKIFNETQLGETHGYAAETVLGKTLKLNLMSVTDNLRHQSINVSFMVAELRGENAYTNVTSYEIVNANIRRLVRRQHDRIDLTMDCVTRDSVSLTLKPLLITRRNTSSAIRTSIRQRARGAIAETVGSLTYEGLFEEIISSRLQRKIKDIMKDIYPIKICEIRKLVADKSTLKNIGSADNKPEKASTDTPEKKEDKKEEKEDKKEEKEAKKEVKKTKKAVKAGDRKEKKDENKDEKSVEKAIKPRKE
ncbi:MAG: hypothetical protein ABH879_01755 [archaeon]